MYISYYRKGIMLYTKICVCNTNTYFVFHKLCIMIYILRKFFIILFILFVCPRNRLSVILIFVIILTLSL